MSQVLIETITSREPGIRNRSLRSILAGMTTPQILAECESLERFRQTTENLYDGVRASLLLFAAHRFYLQDAADVPATGYIPHAGYVDLLERRFEEAIGRFRAVLVRDGPNGAICSALASAYHHATFQMLTDQVRRSVRSARGNQWMFRVGHRADHPVRVRPELLRRPAGCPLYPILCERTPVRIDLSHSGWSDIFFLGMDYPEGARVINISADLGVYQRDREVRPPIETYVRVLGEPVLRLTSVDLEATKDAATLEDLFNFGNDYLGLLKAGVIASGLIPPSFEGSGQDLGEVLARIVGPGMGLEVVAQVNDIPKGSRLAVSTNLLASLIALLMRATGQTLRLEGSLEEDERRLVASRAILGEWLGGSGGGWQDSGGIWPGIKVITGRVAVEGDPEFGVSRGCLLPQHELLGEDRVPAAVREALASSLVLMHGGMAGNVGPILEMVTEKYLLRGEAEWEARRELHQIFDELLEALKRGDVAGVAGCTTRNWEGPLRAIIPAVTNRYTETIIRRVRERAGADFRGFQMLGGMSGGGMGFYVAPQRQMRFRDEVLDIMRQAQDELRDMLPFAIEPLVYEFRINDRGSIAHLKEADEAAMPPRYYAVQVPALARLPRDQVPMLRRADLDHFTSRGKDPQELLRVLRVMVNHLFPAPAGLHEAQTEAWQGQFEQIKQANGFDAVQHEQIRSDLKRGAIGLNRNRLSPDTEIRDVEPQDVIRLETGAGREAAAAGEEALRKGQVAVVSLAAGVGSRWTQGAGVVKAASPFVLIDGRHRSFMEIHLAKSRRTSRRFGVDVPHVFTTSFLTHEAVERALKLNANYGYEGPLLLSPGRSIGLRLVPMTRDLRFLWEELPQETLDEHKQKVREAARRALMAWAAQRGEASDYVENVPRQCFHPPGHWYEVPNMLRNGVLRQLLEHRPSVKYLMVHNIDTLGADLDPAALGAHVLSGKDLTFEVIARRMEDRGGGLARVNGQVRLLEGLAQPREEDEFQLSYYNSMTTWVSVERLLAIFGLTRQQLAGPEELLADRVRAAAARLPTYVTIKDVKRRWGHGQEDVFPVSQTEKLWSDMTSLADVGCGFAAVPRRRGQQLKDVAQFDPWMNDGSLAHLRGLCDFG